MQRARQMAKAGEDGDPQHRDQSTSTLGGGPGRRRGRPGWGRACRPAAARTPGRRTGPAAGTGRSRRRSKVPGPDVGRQVLDRADDQVGQGEGHGGQAVEQGDLGPVTRPPRFGDDIEDDNDGGQLEGGDQGLGADEEVMNEVRYCHSDRILGPEEAAVEPPVGPDLGRGPESSMAGSRPGVGRWPRRQLHLSHPGPPPGGSPRPGSPGRRGRAGRRPTSPAGPAPKPAAHPSTIESEVDLDRELEHRGEREGPGERLQPAGEQVDRQQQTGEEVRPPSVTI